MSEISALLAENAMLKAKLAALEAKQVCRAYPENSAFGSLKKIVDKISAEERDKNVWKNTAIAAMNDLKADPSGKVGEEFVKAVCAAAGLENESTGDKNSKDGTYDQKIGTKKRKVEIKTARIGGGKYQHETLKEDGYDFMMFVDVHPTGGCITILPRFEMKIKHEVTGTKPTLRKGSTDVYKWDFTPTHHKKLVEAKKAIEFDEETTVEEIAEFIRKQIE